MNEIDNILIKQVEDDKTPSVQYIIFNKDSVIHKFQFGFSDIKNKLKTGEQTTYNAYSVTKTFTALSILQLVEQKKLDIDQSVKKIFSRISLLIRNYNSAINDTFRWYSKPYSFKLDTFSRRT